MIKSIVFDKKVFKNFDSTHLIGTHTLRVTTVNPPAGFSAYGTIVFSVDSNGSIHIDTNSSSITSLQFDPNQTTLDGKKLN